MSQFVMPRDFRHSLEFFINRIVHGLILCMLDHSIHSWIPSNQVQICLKLVGQIDDIMRMFKNLKILLAVPSGGGYVDLSPC
jgi:hypothetical protein